MKAELLQDILMCKYHECFLLKTLKLCEDDDPWVTNKIKELDRLQESEFRKFEKIK